MPRPHTKPSILAESRKEHEALEEFLFALAPEQMTEPGMLGEWSVKDVLAHLYEWEQMVLGWLAASQRGESPHVPAEGYKWSQLPALNEMIQEKHSRRTLDELLPMFRNSYEQVMATIENLSEEDLLTPGLYPWMNKNTLAAYFVSCTSSHYRWARKEMKKGLKT
ncbi:MAG: ClbS/DfsB family four-helix bundle protein [Anaerolineales bacterium]|nr:ClbS/DfsB family four-helix bundle protein [Anaerolineales bacterium]